MKEFKYLKYTLENDISTVQLNRPEVHNAFNDDLINEVIEAFNLIEKDSSRIVVLTGEGRSFCAGADLNWMSSMINYSMEENIADSQKLAQMFQTINDCHKPVLGKINGHALGGGVGLVAVCDYALTHNKAKFGFTEARLGLIPAVISPFCIRKIGESNARAWFLSGEMFLGEKAMHMGLVHEVTSVDEYEERFNALVESFLKAAPIAAKNAKDLINNVLQKDLDSNKESVTQYTCEAIAKQRISSEGQEGMKALLEKTKPSWVK